MGNLFANRKFVVTANQIEEDGMLSTFSGDIFVSKGSVLLTDLDGNTFPVTESYFKEYYIPIQKVEPKKIKPSKSPFEEAYLDEVAKAYSQDWVTGNTDETYIALPEKLRSNKAF